MRFPFFTTRWRALLKGLHGFRAGYRTGLSIERSRLGFLADMRAGYTPEQCFLLTMRAGGHTPGTQIYGDMRELVEGFARDAGIGWSEVMK